MISGSEKLLPFCVSPVLAMENILTAPIVKKEDFPLKLFKIYLLSAYDIHKKLYGKTAGHYCACEFFRPRKLNSQPPYLEK